MTFSEFDLHPSLLRGVEDLGFVQATPIQQDAIPPALKGRDVLACAMTGSGKSAAFLLPIMQQLGARDAGVTRALILTPTRELAAQIDDHRAQLGRQTQITGAAVFGGVGMAPQERAFRTGVDIMVATPGRLLDHFSHPYAKLSGLEILVLDEADRMLDMGFLPDIRRILSHLPRKRQTMLFSATLPGPIVQLAREMLVDPVTLNIERQSAPAVGITHAVYEVSQTLKSPLLLHLLKQDDMQSVVVFTRTKHRANRLADYLEKHGVSSARIHGNRSQGQRTEALSGFRRGEYRVLVATDIAARGIDIEALSHVVNFDVPHVPEDYIHRVGRTARAERTGDAFTFVSPEETGDIRAIERAMNARIPRREVPAMQAPQEQPETPIGERIAAIRARKAEERARAAETAARKAPAPPPAASRAPGTGGGSRRPRGGGGGSRTAPAPESQLRHAVRPLVPPTTGELGSLHPIPNVRTSERLNAERGSTSSPSHYIAPARVRVTARGSTAASSAVWTGVSRSTEIWSAPRAISCKKKRARWVYSHWFRIAVQFAGAPVSAQPNMRVFAGYTHSQKAVCAATMHTAAVTVGHSASGRSHTRYTSPSVASTAPISHQPAILP
jgi:ATP-dependent RNA helicase RhlE